MVDNDGLSKLPEYQYHLKDHLGNVRLTFSADPETESNTATLETAHEEEESSTFLRYPETTKINSTFFDHTNNGDTHYAVRLNGSENERIGLAKSLAVMTGDTIKAEVYAKYLDPDQNNWTAALQNLMAAIAGGTAPTGTVIEAVPASGGDGFPFGGLLGAAKAGETGPQAYLNILVFDENLDTLDMAYAPVTDAAKENGSNTVHEKLALEIVAQQPGYVYIYLSNDNEQPLEVFFDDFTVEHAHSAIVQADDYYPFGLSFNSYKRENSVKNKWKFQGQEHIEDFGLNWVSFKWRNHQPDIGRFFNVDPLAEKYVYNSPYAFSENHVTSHIELEGLEKIFFQKAAKYNSNFKKVYSVQRRTSGGQEFTSKLKNQKDYNVLYFQMDGWATGISTSVSNMQDFKKLKERSKKTYGGLSEKGVEKALEGKKLLLIGVDITNLENTNEGTYTLNHEEFHGASTLDGNVGNDKNSEDHEKYYGEKTEYSPDDQDVKTKPNYANSEAKKQYEEIDKIIKEDEKKQY